MGSLSKLVIALAVATAPALAGCHRGASTVVLARSPTNPLAQTALYRLMPVDETRLDAPPGTAPAVEAAFAEGLAGAAGPLGLRVVGATSPEPAPLLLWPTLTLAGRPGGEVRVRIRVTTPGGAIVEEVAVRSSPDPRAPGEDPSRAAGVAVALYLRDRAGTDAEPITAFACPAPER